MSRYHAVCLITLQQKHSKLKSDFRKIVEEMKFEARNKGGSRAVQVWANRIEKLLEGE